MSYFNQREPFLRSKSYLLQVPELTGFRRIDWRLGQYLLHSSFYTPLDQACLIWSGLVAPMFLTAQFLPISWKTQAILWTILTVIGLIITAILTRHWVDNHRVYWIVTGWIILMIGGLIMTDLAVFLGWGLVLMNLCPLWLALIGLGYIVAAWGVRSRFLRVAGFLHFVTILGLPYVPEWQFLITGFVVVFFSWLVAEFQWDDRL